MGSEMCIRDRAGDATDYEITTQSDIVDLIIGGFTGGLIVSRKVTVTK